MWQLQHTYLRSTLASSALRPPPVSLTHDMLVHKGMTAAPLDWIVLTWNGRHDLSTKLFPLSLVVLLYPFLADQYIILSLNIRIFQTHFLYFIWLFSLNGFLKSANTRNLFEIVSCSCRTSCFKECKSDLMWECCGSKSLSDKILTFGKSHLTHVSNNVYCIKIKPNYHTWNLNIDTIWHYR